MCSFSSVFPPEENWRQNLPFLVVDPDVMHIVVTNLPLVFIGVFLIVSLFYYKTREGHPSHKHPTQVKEEGKTKKGEKGEGEGQLEEEEEGQKRED